MLIGIDAREICGKPTGVGRYLNRLLSHWAQLPRAQAHRFLLLAPSAPASPLPSSRFELRIIAGGAGTRWEQTALAAAATEARPDVFFAPAYSAPLRISSPVVLTMHDVSFVTHPEWFRWRERLRRTWLARLSARKARLVLAVSDHARGEIIAHLHVAPSRIRVIPHGIDAPGGPQSRQASRAREAMILFAGSIFNRRHLPDLIRAFARIAPRHPDATLEIVGENRTHPHEDLDRLVRTLGLPDRVRVRSYEPDDVLGALYARASVFAFLSDYEGFGLPPLEALASGVPVVLTDTPIAREIFGDAAHYVPRGDVDAVARQLEALLFDAQARRDVLDRAPRVLARYSWQRAAQDTLAAFEEAAGSP